MFQSGDKEVNEDLKDFSFWIMETILKEMATVGTLEDIFEKSMEMRTKSPTFMDPSASRDLISSRFVRTVAKFICEKIKKNTTKPTSLGRDLDVSLSKALAFSSLSKIFVNVKSCKMRRIITRKRTSRTKKNDEIIAKIKS